MTEILTAFGIDWRLVVIQVFNFMILMGILWYFLYTPVLDVLKKRQEVIKRGVEDAKEAGEALERAEEGKKEVLSLAEREAEQIHVRAKLHADERAAEIIQNAEERMERMLRDAELRSEDIKDSAFRQSEKEIAKTALLSAEKILREGAGNT